LNQLDIDNLDDALREVGIEPQKPSSPPDPRQLDEDEVASEITDLWGEDAIELEAGTGDELGAPGTPFLDDLPDTPGARYGPRVVRGTRGDWGLYEEYYRTEPQIQDAVSSIREVLVGSDYRVEAPDGIPDQQGAAVDEFVEWCNAWLHSIEGGLNKFVGESADSLLIYGLQMHEIVWGKDEDQRLHPVKFGYREPSTIEEWILDDRMADLIGVHFNILRGGDYTLPATGPDLTDRKVAHAALGQRGNNFEGVSPIRPAIHWIKLKRLLANIIGVSAEKYGTPIVTVQEEGTVGRAASGEATDEDRQRLTQIMQSIRASEGAVIELPPDLDFEMHSPSGSMPKFLDLLDYCDQQISQQYANQGSLLGQGDAVGSYALAKQSDSKFLRQAPAIARKIFEPIEQIIRWTWQSEWADDHGDLPAYPTVEMSLSDGQDVSQWISDASTLMGKQPVNTWPDELKREAFQKLGVEPPSEGSDDVAATGESDSMEEGEQ